MYPVCSDLDLPEFTFKLFSGSGSRSIKKLQISMEGLKQKFYTNLRYLVSYVFSKIKACNLTPVLSKDEKC